jgi:hypothetical protein
MEDKAAEIIYLGFLLPALFSLTLVIEGVYRVTKKEGGLFNILLGIVLLSGLTLFYIIALKK